MRRPVSISSMNRRAARTGLWIVLCVTCVSCLAVAIVMLSGSRSTKAAAVSKAPPVELVEGSTRTMRLSESVRRALEVRTVAVEPTGSYETLSLAGSLFLDSSRLTHVHSRFSGEVVSMGLVPDLAPGKLLSPDDPEPNMRPLRVGDPVIKDQVLAVIWSKEVGEKKSDLVDALSKSYLDKAHLDRLATIKGGVVPERTLREAEREYESDIIAVERHERTLRSWKLTAAEIELLREEAQRIHRGEPRPEHKYDKNWAEIDVRAPFDGVVLEKNITTGDIVNTELDLFKIADLRRLGVLANVYEEDLGTVTKLSSDERRWTIFLNSQSDAPGIDGTFELVGNVVDPLQHTAAVMGWIDNANGQLRAGQFITAKIKLPASSGILAAPVTAVIEEGDRSVVFVATDDTASVVERRYVAVVSRGPEEVFIRANPTEAEHKAGCEPLKAGERLVTSGTIELAGALDTLLASLPTPVEPEETLRE